MRNKFQIYLFFLFLCTWFVSCKKVPSGILSEKNMQSVMADVQLAEAMITSDYSAYSKEGSKEALFTSVFQKHNITQAQYDSSLVWYGRNMDIYMRVCDAVIAQLDKQKDAFGDIQPDAGPVEDKDSVNIWTRRDYVVFQPTDPGYGVYFDYKPSRGYLPGSQFLLSMDVWGLTPDMKHKPVVRLSLQQQDTTITVIREITEDGLFEMFAKTVATKRVMRVYGYIHLDKTMGNYHRIYIDTICLTRYNYGREIKLSGSPTEANLPETSSLPADSLNNKTGASAPR